MRAALGSASSRRRSAGIGGSSRIAEGGEPNATICTGSSPRRSRRRARARGGTRRAAPARRSAAPAGGGTRQLEVLADVAHVEGAGEPPPGRRRRPRDRATRTRRCSSVVEAAAPGPPPSAASSSATRVRTRSSRSGSTSSPRAHRMPGAGGHQHPPDAEIAGQGRRVERPGAAEGDQRVAARIVALAHRDDPDGAEHVGLHDGEDAARRLDRSTCRARRPAGRSAASASSRRSGHAAVEQVRRRSTGPARRWRRSRSGACRRARSRPGPDAAPALCGPDPERAAGVDPGDAAAAGADALDLERTGSARDSRRSCARAPITGLAALDASHVRRRPAHVERDDGVDARRPRDPRRAHHARAGPGEQRAHRLLGGGGDRDDAAVRLVDVRRRAASPSRPTSSPKRWSSG